MGHRPRTNVPASRPRPIADAADTVTTWTALVAPILTALVGYGVISLATADAITGLLGVLPGVIVAVTNLLTAIGIVRKAEPDVTPLASPRARDGSQLVTMTAVKTALATRPRHARAPEPAWWGTAGDEVDVHTFADGPAPDDETPDTLTLTDGMGQRIAEAVEMVDRAVAEDLAAAGRPSAPDTPAPAPAPVDTRTDTGSHDSGHHSASSSDSGSSGSGGE